MRVAVVVRSLKIGGMERIAVNLSESFAKDGHEAHLIYFKSKDKSFTAIAPVQMHHFDLEKSLMLTGIGLILHVFSKWFNILFRQTYYFWQGLFLAPIFRYKLRKIEKQHGKFDLIIMRGHGTFEFTWPLKDERIVQMIESIFVAHGSTQMDFYLRRMYNGKNIACVSNGVKQRVEKAVKIANASPKRIDIINNPLNVPLIQEQANDYLPHLKEKYIVSVTRMDPNKNIALLVDAYAYAREHLNLRHKLVIVGDGNQRASIETKIKTYAIEEHVHLLGLLTNPFPWVKHADLFALTSFAEGLPTVLLEALACDTEIVAADGEGGIRDILKDELSSHICSFDPKEYAKKMLEILSKKEKTNTKKFLEPYLPSTIVNTYINKYLS